MTHVLPCFFSLSSNICRSMLPSTVRFRFTQFRFRNSFSANILPQYYVWQTTWQYSYEKLDWRGTDLGLYAPIMYSFEVDSYHGLQ